MLTVVRLARFPGGDNPAFKQRLEPFLPAEQSRGLGRLDLARRGNCHRDAGSGHIIGCLIHDEHVILAKNGKPATKIVAPTALKFGMSVGLTGAVSGGMQEVCGMRKVAG